MPHTLEIILGPTAVGKTGYAIARALEVGSPVISCDSRQIYQGLTIGTAAPSKEELAAVPEVGEVIAESVYKYFRDERHLKEIERLKAAGLQMAVVRKAENASDALAGKTIVISGNFSVSRDEMKALIEANGGKNSGSVSGKTAFLLAGSKPGPEKIRKAESLGIPILDEEAFRKLLPEGALPETPQDNNSELTLF